MTDRPQNNFQIEGNHFRGAQEFKFGFGYRKASVASQSGFPGGVLNIHGWRPASARPIPTCCRSSRATRTAKANAVYWSAFLGDQISMDRLTLNLGLRWDRQVANLEASTVAANPFDAAARGARPPPGAGRRDGLELDHAAHRPDLRADRIAQDDRAGQLRDVRVAVAGRPRGGCVGDSGDQYRLGLRLLARRAT